MTVSVIYFSIALIWSILWVIYCYNHTEKYSKIYRIGFSFLTFVVNFVLFPFALMIYSMAPSWKEHRMNILKKLN